MDTALLEVTAVIYLIGSGGFIAYLVLLKDFLLRISPFLLLAGFVVHTVALALHFVEIGYLAPAEFGDALWFYSWLMVGLYLVIQFKYRLTVLGSIIAPLAFLMSVSAFAVGKSGDLPQELKTYWLPLHVSFAFLGNALFALAFGVSVMYLVLEHQLKKKKMNLLIQRFPPLESLDRLNYALIVWGFPLMTLGIITGSLWAGSHWGNYWVWEPRQISSAIIWLLYGALLHGRMAAGWRGRKTALLTIVGFAVVLGYFLGGDALFPGRHGGRFE
jgi:cytochrome c-type biogenesis protein CcsB